MDKSPKSSLRPLQISNWLFVMAIMVVVMVVVGGITRLTESGLSITEWKPISGALPPLSAAEWQAQFAKYQQIPEYKLVTGPAGMTLEDFKFIFFWEWFHRLWGRLIGLAFAVPLLYFAVKRAIPGGYSWKLVGLLALGALQGAFGWFMVASGLSGKMTDVSHFWLSIHLSTALITLSGLIWVACDLRAHAANPHHRPARVSGFTSAIFAIVFIQLVLGAWVAGLNAGLASDTWPFMNGRFVPEYDSAKGLLYAATHDPFIIHFLHRWWAWIVVAALVVLCRRVRQYSRAASLVIHSLFGTQIIVGIATVLTGVTLWIAVLHQFIGACLVAATVWGMHILGTRHGRPL